MQSHQSIVPGGIFSISLLIIVWLSGSSLNAETLTLEEAEARLRLALQIARERNDKSLVGDLNRVGK